MSSTTPDRQVAELVNTLRIDASVVLCSVVVGTRVWCGCVDGTVRVRDAANGKLIFKMKTGDAQVFTIVHSGDSIWCGLSDGRIMTFIPQSGDISNEFSSGSAPITAMLSHGPYIWCGTDDGAIIVINCKTMQSYGPIPAHKDCVQAICCTDSAVWTGSEDGGIRVWDIETLISKKEIPGSDNPLTSMCSANNQIWTGHDDGRIYVWDANDATIITELNGHEQKINALLPVSNYVWSGCDDSHINIWNNITFDLVATLSHHSAGISSILLVNRTTVWSASHDATIAIWDHNSSESPISPLLEMSAYHESRHGSVTSFHNVDVYQTPKTPTSPISGSTSKPTFADPYAGQSRSISNLGQKHWNAADAASNAPDGHLPIDVSVRELEVLHRELQVEIDLRREAESKLDEALRKNDELQKLVRENIALNMRVGSSLPDSQAVAQLQRENQILRDQNEQLNARLEEARRTISTYESDPNSHGQLPGGNEQLKRLIELKDRLIRSLLKKKSTAEASSNALSDAALSLYSTLPTDVDGKAPSTDEFDLYVKLLERDLELNEARRQIQNLENHLMLLQETNESILSGSTTDEKVRLVTMRLMQESREKDSLSKEIGLLKQKLHYYENSGADKKPSKSTLEPDYSSEFWAFVRVLATELRIDAHSSRNLDEMKVLISQSVKEIMSERTHKSNTSKSSSSDNEALKETFHSLRMAQLEIDSLKDEISYLRISTPREIRPAPSLLEQELSILKMKLQEETNSRIAAEAQVNSLHIELNQFKTEMQQQHASQISGGNARMPSYSEVNPYPQQQSRISTNPPNPPNPPTQSQPRNFEYVQAPVSDSLILRDQPTSTRSWQNPAQTQSANQNQTPYPAHTQPPSEAITPRSSFLKSIWDSSEITPSLRSMPPTAINQTYTQGTAPVQKKSLAAKLGATRNFTIYGGGNLVS